MELLRHRHRGPVPLEPLLGGVALGRQALGLPGLLEHRRRSARSASEEVRRSFAPASGVAVALELGQGQLAMVDEALLAVDHLLGDLQPARVLLALRLQLEDRPLEALLRPRRCRGRRR
jgi:hypothetical protein